MLQSKKTMDPAGPRGADFPWFQQILQSFLRRHAVLLPLQRLQKVLLGCPAGAADIDFMGARDQHQRAVEFVAFRQKQRNTQCPHPWHPVFHMPRFKIRVPEELPAVQWRLVVDSRLMNVHLCSQQLANAGQNPVIGKQLLKSSLAVIDKNLRPVPPRGNRREESAADKRRAHHGFPDQPEAD